MQRRAGVLGGQRYQLPLELELQVVVSHPMWVLGSKLQPSARCYAIFPTKRLVQTPDCWRSSECYCIQFQQLTPQSIRLRRPKGKVFNNGSTLDAVTRRVPKTLINKLKISESLRTIQTRPRKDGEGDLRLGISVRIMLLPRNRSEPGTCRD